MIEQQLLFLLNHTYTKESYHGAVNYLQHTRSLINETAQEYEPVTLIFVTVISVLALQRIINFLWNEDESLSTRIKVSFFKFVRSLPIVSYFIRKELDSAILGMKKSINKPIEGSKPRFALPADGSSQTEILKELDILRTCGHVDYGKGRISGTVYFGESAYKNDGPLTEFLVKAYGMFALSNPLHSDVFPGVRKMEAEVVQMVVNLYHGDTNCCGTMTSGGTESILMACKAYRDRAYERGITKPEMIIPESAHAAFDKAAGYFKIKLIKTPVNAKTRRANVNAIRKAITSNTIMIVGSCPSFPHGVIDPIEELSDLALEFDVGLHVDCCLGGFLVPFMKDAGFKVPLFDFRLPGVTSISCDTHKYGFSPKGSSVVMYSTHKLREYQYFVAPDWSGGIYASPSIAGSRPGALIAATWACLVYFGRKGYVDTTRKIINTTRTILAALKKIDGIKIYGEPDASVIAVGSDVFDIYRLSGALNEKGWNLNSLQFPSSFHICVTYVHTLDHVADDFIEDVRSSVAEIMKNPKAKAHGTAAIYGQSQGIPDRSLIGYVTAGYLNAVYDTKPVVSDSTDSKSATLASTNQKKGKK